MSAPDKIWVDPEYIDCMGTLDMTCALPNDVEYVRADLCHASPMDVREAARVLLAMPRNAPTSIFVNRMFAGLPPPKSYSDAQEAVNDWLRAIAETGGGE